MNDISVEVIKALPGALATIAAAGAAAYFAKKQSDIAKINSDIAYDKLKLELFERRYKIYEAFKAMLNSMCLADTKGFDEVKFAGEYEIARECVFYFGPDINAFSESVFERASDILSAQSKIAELKKSDNPILDNAIKLEELRGVDVRAAYKDNSEVATYISDLDAKEKLKKDLTIVIADASAQSRVDYQSLPEKFQTSIGFSTLKK